MLQGLTLFKCTECGNCFMAPDFELGASMLSAPQKCPHCGSYNTELKISGNVGYGVVKGARIAAAGIAHVAGEIFGRYAGHAAGHAVLNSTKDWGEDIDRHHCCNCGKDFI